MVHLSISRLLRNLKREDVAPAELAWIIDAPDGCDVPSIIQFCTVVLLPAARISVDPEDGLGSWIWMPSMITLLSVTEK